MQNITELGKLPIFRKYTIRWKYGELEGIETIVADDAEFAIAKLWRALGNIYRPVRNRKKEHKIIKVENYNS